MGGKAMINSAIITSAETAIREMVVQAKRVCLFFVKGILISRSVWFM